MAVQESSTALELIKLAWLIPAFPLLGAGLLWVGRKHLKEPAAGWLATAMMFLSFCSAATVFLAMTALDHHDRAVSLHLFDWIRAGGFTVKMGIFADPLAVTMTLFITGVGTLIHLYSIAYMHGEPRFTRFFTFLNLFAFSMLALVLGGNYLLIFLGWEGVGLCSYLLISFYCERPSAARAGKKAFVTNRVGDFGFMLAIFLIFAKLGTIEMGDVLAGAGHLPEGTATAIALLLFLAAAGKSAQGPLFVWLPDAMEGPTPVSALIHAATMVTAGVYLMCRSHPFLVSSASAGEVIAWVGVITALVAATIALVNNDIKRVLAYSTISQLGYMFLAVGVGAYTAALFHMVTHAFFKALMFLGAGSVIHGLGEEQDMRKMGGLRKWMPVTAYTFIFGWLAIAGIVPLAGFWSKDEILAGAWTSDAGGHYLLWGLGAVTALLTAFYMTRQVRMVFFGEERWREHSEHATPHESPALMTFPLVTLAVLSLLGSMLNLPFKGWDLMHHWLEPVFEGFEQPEVDSFNEGFMLSTAAVILGVIGIVAAVRVYHGKLKKAEDPDPVPKLLGPAAPLFANGWYIDPGIAAMVDGPGRQVAEVMAGPVDQKSVDGAVNGVAALVALASRNLRRLQTGFVRNYALGIFAGGTLAMLFLLVRGGVG